jgi:hypothetical protein
MLRSILQKVSTTNEKTEPTANESIKEESESISSEHIPLQNTLKPHQSIEREAAPLATLDLDHSKRDSSLFRSFESLKFYFTYDYENGSGELYMRAGLAIFAMFGMIDRCLSLIQMIETNTNNIEAIKDCNIIVSIVNKSISTCFIFAQSFFIFKYANLVISYRTNWLSVGLMHLVCTNFCVFFRTVVMETVAEIRHEQLENHSSILHISSTTHSYLISGNSTRISKKAALYTRWKQLGCIKTVDFTTDISVGVQQAQDRMSPYIYPCIIEYSLMCLTVFYILWSNIGQKHAPSSEKPEANHRRPHLYEKNVALLKSTFDSNTDSETRRSSLSLYENRRVNQYIIDCGKSTTGLFFGILVLLLTIISLITYFIYKSHNPIAAMIISELTELILISFSFVITSLICFKLYRVDFSQKKTLEMDYNETLVVVGLGGIYMYGFYSIVAIVQTGLGSTVNSLSFSIQIAGIVEATFQSFLIVNALQMYTKSKAIRKSKPARSLITLLILVDVSLWLSETFSVKKYDMNRVQLDYYDTVFWSIVSSIASPLAIFFRFHASVCLSDIWKNLYQ